MAANLQLISVPQMPVVAAGDDLAAMIVRCLASAGLALEPHDVVVLAQKIVSKSEDRFVDLATVTPSATAATRPSAIRGPASTIAAHSSARRWLA